MKKIVMPLLLVTLIFAISATASAAELKFDTPSEAYQEYLELSPEEQSMRTPPMQAKLRTEEDSSLWSNGSLPEKFDLRNVDTDGDGVGDISYVTPPRNQLMSDDCWAFAFASAAESRWKYQTAEEGGAEEIDLSELHIDYSLANLLKAGQFNPDGGRTHFGSGGQALMAAAYAARGSGLVLEDDLPFTDTGENAYLSSVYKTPLFRAAEIKVSNHDLDQNQITDTMINRLKADLMNGSAITVNILHDLPYENDFNGSFYNDSTEFGEFNHAISIVGWDDTYAAENFNKDPGRDGAWIVKDNYALEVGDQGYRYLSYMDKSAYGYNVQVLEMEDYREDVPYDNRYYHDPSWFTSAFGYEDSGNTTFGMNVFDKQEGDESVQFVNLAFNGPTDYDVYIIDEDTMIDSQTIDLSAAEPAASGHTSYAGYFDIPLDKPVMVSGDRFAVVVKYHADNAFYIVPFEQKTEYPFSWYDYYSTAPAGSSYASPDGKTWEELSTPERQANCTIKAFTTDSKPKAKIAFRIDQDETTVYVTNLSGKRIPANADGTYSLRDGTYRYTAQREGFADVTEDFTVSEDAELPVTEPSKETGTAPYVQNDIEYLIAPYDKTLVKIEFSLGTGTKAAQGFSLRCGDDTCVEGEDYYIEDGNIIFTETAFPDEELYEAQGHMLTFTIEFDDEAKTTQEFYLSVASMDAARVINTYIANHLNATKEDILAYADTLSDTQIVFGDDFEITPFAITGKMIVTHDGRDTVQEYTGYSRALTTVKYIIDQRAGFLYQTTTLADSPYQILCAQYDEDGKFKQVKALPFGYCILPMQEEPYTYKFLQLDSWQSLKPLMKPNVVKVSGQPSAAAMPAEAVVGPDGAYTVTIHGLTQGRQYVVLVVDDPAGGVSLPDILSEDLGGITYLDQLEADGDTVVFGPFKPLGGSGSNKIFLGGGEAPVYLGTLQSLSEGGGESSGSSGSRGGSTSTRPSAKVDGTGGKVTTGSGTVTITPDDGYRIAKITVNGKAADIPEDGKLTGLKTSDKVVVTFEKIPETPDVPDPLAKFTDLQPDAWYSDAVRYVVDNGLFAGISGTTFSPDDTMTRAMLVTVLYRAEGEPSIENEILGYPFADVDAESWYGAAVYWARLKGITAGTSEETFSPDGSITREQLAAMLYRYAGRPAATGQLDSFTDAATVSSYATDALKWAVEQGIITGKGNGVLDPKGNATRAQVAAMLMRYLQD